MEFDCFEFVVCFGFVVSLVLFVSFLVLFVERLAEFGPVVVRSVAAVAVVRMIPTP